MVTQTNRVAVVTGGSKGIGSSIARRLAADGFAVAVNYARGADAAKDLCHRIEADGGRAAAFQADVSRPNDVARLFDDVEAQFGAPAVLVNNAGIMTLSGIADVSNEEVDRLLDVNLKGVIHCLREAMNRLGHGGRIINLSSTVVALSMPNYGVYTATKSAVEALTRVASKELRGRSITVNAVAPGPTATGLFLKDKSDEQVEALTKSNPLERLGAPEDIANAVAFLAGPDGGWINGQVLRANGGMA